MCLGIHLRSLLKAGFVALGPYESALPTSSQVTQFQSLTYGSMFEVPAIVITLSCMAIKIFFLSNAPLENRER